MGKSIISQARGHGSLTYQARKKAYVHRIQYPKADGEAEILDLLHSPAHSAPLIKVKIGKEIFYNPAFNGAFVGQKIVVGGQNAQQGNILQIRNIPVGTSVFNIERNPGDGGKMLRASGTSAIVTKKIGDRVAVLMPNKNEIVLPGECRASIGIVAGSGRILKPFVKAGRKFYKMKARNKLWPRTSAVKMNAVDHPFGSGRGKRIKSKIAKRNAPPGARVGHIRPRRTGRTK
ncbi:MAG: 50S ribosomal protein L2 [Candidatus Pacearchaeota archaeon]